MTRPWNPRVIWGGRGGNRPPPRMPREWDAYRRPPWWRRRLVWNAGEIRLMLLGGIVAGLALAFATSAPSGPDGTITQAAAVRIIDGDTFDYGGSRIRIADIDTPEVDGRCAYEEQLAGKATERMAELLHAGPFELEPIPGRDEDRYGRKLRIVTRDGRSLGDQLVAEGLARTWTGRREPWC